MVGKEEDRRGCKVKLRSSASSHHLPSSHHCEFAKFRGSKEQAAKSRVRGEATTREDFEREAD